MGFEEKHLVPQVVFRGGGSSQGTRAHPSDPEHLHWMIPWVMGFLSLPPRIWFWLFCIYWHWLVGYGVVGRASVPLMCLQGHPHRKRERERDTPSIVRNPPKLEICFRKLCGLIIVIPHSAEKSKFSLRATQKYKKWGLKYGFEECYICVFLAKKSNSSLFETVHSVDSSWYHDLESCEA